MTAQDHIDALGEAQIELEETLDEMRAAADRVERLSKVAIRKARKVHTLMDAAQKAYVEEHGSGDNVVALFSGGTDKPPPPPNPDEPVEP